MTGLMNFKGKKKSELVAMLEELYCCEAPRVSVADDIARVFRGVIGRKRQEHFLVCYLDGANKILKTDVVFIGTLNKCIVHPREIFAPAIELRAASVILGHNHPSDNLEPSLEDMNITRRLVEAGKILGIEILDHVIFTKTRHYSFQGNGKI
jgi:DNA repair protein RadC